MIPTLTIGLRSCLYGIFGKCPTTRGVLHMTRWAKGRWTGREPRLKLPPGPIKLERMVRPERFELPTFWFVARRSIQLS